MKIPKPIEKLGRKIIDTLDPMGSTITILKKNGFEPVDGCMHIWPGISADIPHYEPHVCGYEIYKKNRDGVADVVAISPFVVLSTYRVGEETTLSGHCPYITCLYRPIMSGSPQFNMPLYKEKIPEFYNYIRRQFSQ